MKSMSIRTIAIFLLLCMFTLSLSSCFNEINNETSQPTDSSSESNQETTEQGQEESDNVDSITLFKDGQYLAKMTRSDLPSSSDKELYNRLKSIFKSKTSKAILNSTDFVAAGFMS